MISQYSDQYERPGSVKRKQHEESKNIGNELVNIKSETLHLSEDNKGLK